MNPNPIDSASELDTIDCRPDFNVDFTWLVLPLLRSVSDASSSEASMTIDYCGRSVGATRVRSFAACKLNLDFTLSNIVASAAMDCLTVIAR